MMRVWLWMFVPATGCVLAGLLFPAGAAHSPGRFMDWSPEASALALVALLIAGVVGFIAYFRRFRPGLAVED